MKVTATEHIRAIGFTADNAHVALELRAVDGEMVTVEFPVSALPALGHLTTQIADIHTKQMGGVYRAPSLPIAKWSAGHNQEANMMVVQFDLPGGGAYGVRFDRQLAQGLRDALDAFLHGAPGSSASMN